MQLHLGWLLVASTSLLLSALTVFTGWVILPIVVHHQVGKELALVNGSAAWKRWIETPVPIFFKVFIFNVMNPQQVMLGSKPHVMEIGPYVYREYRKKEVVKVDEDRDTVFYYQGILFEFDQEASGSLTENDIHTIINPALLGVTQVLENIHGISPLVELVDYTIKSVFANASSVFLNATVHMLLFDGIVLRCNLQAPNFADRIICSALKHAGPLKLFTEIPEGDFSMAMLGYKNTSFDGLFEVNRGIQNSIELGRIVSWNGQKELSTWGGSSCNQVSGSDMTLLHPFLNKKSDIIIFSSDICTNTRLKFMDVVDVMGINAYRFQPVESFLGDVRDYPENYCYCPGSIKQLTTPNACLKCGAIDISSCLDVPGILSHPHFYKSSSDYTNGIDGLHQNGSLHETFMDIEPLTGIPLRGYRRIQINLLMKKTSAVQVMKNLPDVLFPLFWIDEGSVISEQEVKMFDTMLFYLLRKATIVKWALIGGGVTVACISTVLSILCAKSPI